MVQQWLGKQSQRTSDPLISEGREWGVGSVLVGFRVFLGRPDFPSTGPKTILNKYCGASGLQSGAPQKRETQPRRIQPPILNPLILSEVRAYKVRAGSLSIIIIDISLYISLYLLYISGWQHVELQVDKRGQ